VTLGLCRRPQETHQAHVAAAIAFNRGTDSHRRDLKTAETLLFVSTAYMHCQESMSLWKEMPTHGSAAEGDQSRSRRRVVNKQERRSHSGAPPGRISYSCLFPGLASLTRGYSSHGPLRGLKPLGGAGRK